MRKLALKGLYGLVGIVVSSIVTAWISGQPLTGLTRLKGLFEIFIRGSVPAWIFAPIFLAALFGTQHFIAFKLKHKKRLHFVPDAHNCGWSPVSGSVMFVRLGGTFTYEGQGSLSLLKCFLSRTQPTTDMLAEVDPIDGTARKLRVTRIDLPSSVPVKAFLNLRVTPLRGVPGKAYNSRLKFRDSYNRVYDVGPVELPYAGPPAS